MSIPTEVVAQCRAKVATLSARELDDVITGRVRLGDSADLDLLMWNLAVDEERDRA